MEYYSSSCIIFFPKSLEFTSDNFVPDIILFLLRLTLLSFSLFPGHNGLPLRLPFFQRASSSFSFSASVCTTPRPMVSVIGRGFLCKSAVAQAFVEIWSKRSPVISSPAQFISPLTISPRTVFIVPSWLAISMFFELIILVDEFCDSDFFNVCVVAECFLQYSS